MIEIQINNAQELAEVRQGQFKMFLAKLFGINLQGKVEVAIASRLQDELAKQGVVAEVIVK